MSEPRPPFVRRVILRNYKSIKECDVSLGPLTFLVGPNGSGKSNFLDALRFLSDSLQTNLRHAFKERGDTLGVFRRAKDVSSHFSIELQMNLPDGDRASYSVSLGHHNLVWRIEEEQCSVCAASGGEKASFLVKQTQVDREVEKSSLPNAPPALEEQLYLFTVAGYPEFSAVYLLLRGMRFYNIDPQQIRREASSGKPSRELARSGDGALFTAHRLFHNEPVKASVLEYLRAVLPTLDEVRFRTTETDISSHQGFFAGKEGEGGVKDPLAGDPVSLKFLFCPSDTYLAFDPQNVSDGTLRAFGVLLALFQCLDRPANDAIPLVGIEEPEATLHPAAAGVLFDALREASHFTQVLVTTHSPDLLDIPDLDADSLLIVDMVAGSSVIGQADEVSKSIMRDRLSTAGELLRQDQLRPESGSAGPVGAETD